ncbi:MAG TPA: hypothetical protein VKA40_04880, partial [Nitrososphaera sp.]|nr:hypothetical protein [Nitrososphaera sp.]
GNFVYDNAVSDSDIGIRAVRSHNNIVQNTTFSDIEASEYRLLADSSLTIRGQQFDDDVDVLITEDDFQTTGSSLEIVNSGIIEVREDGEGDDDTGEEDSDGDDEEEDGGSFNTDIQPYRRTLSDGDTITVTSSES